MLRAFIKSIAVSVWLCSIGGAAAAQTTVTGATLFQNVRIYDGTGKSLSAPSNVLVRGNRIERISPRAIAPEPAATVIEGNGRVLMPGLIDAHWHSMLVRPPPSC